MIQPEGHWVERIPSTQESQLGDLMMMMMMMMMIRTRIQTVIAVKTFSLYQKQSVNYFFTIR